MVIYGYDLIDRVCFSLFTYNILIVHVFIISKMKLCPVVGMSHYVAFACKYTANCIFVEEIVENIF